MAQEKDKTRILIVDDDVDVLRAAHLLLKRHFVSVDIEKDPRQIPYLLNRYDYGLILLDMNFTRDMNSGHEGFEWLNRILSVSPHTAVVLITAYGDIEMAVKAIKQGAVDFVLKPWENNKLLAVIQKALKRQSDIAEKSSAESGENIIAHSPALLAVLKTAEQVAKTDANVLILGENGTGKDIMARYIHRKSLRHKQKLVTVDMGAIAENLFESELFGHVKGAFTDARDDRQGRFEEADGGSLFLDEISNLSLSLQAKLLTVLQSRNLSPVGANKAIKVDVRLISASNRNLQQMVENQLFRQDLYYRINTIEIHLPPLRERKEDIIPLAMHYLQHYCEKYNRQIDGLSEVLTMRIQSHPWPGNVRELQHAIERAVILTQGNLLETASVFKDAAKLDVNSDTPTQNIDSTLEDMERQLVLKALSRANGNVSHAAKELGLSRAALYRRMEKHGI